MLIVYDSLYGNTRTIALSLAAGFGKRDHVRLLRAEEATTADLEGVDLLVVGSPVHGGRASEKMREFLDTIPANGLADIRAAAFDTRIPLEAVGIFLKLLMRTIGYASPRMARTLEGKGAFLVAEPEGFFVEDKDGPLKKGETARAKKWAGMLAG